MFKLESTHGPFTVMGRGTVYVVESPVAAPRTEMVAALGPQVELNGVVCTPIAYELYALGGPVRVGERMGLILREPI